MTSTLVSAVVSVYTTKRPSGVHQTTEPCVARLVDLAESARAEQGFDFVRAEPRAGSERHRFVAPIAYSFGGSAPISQRTK
jgi:hypothetical protein